MTTTLNVNQGADNDGVNGGGGGDDDVMKMLRDILGVSSRNNDMNGGEDERVEANLEPCDVQNDNAMIQI